MPSLEVQGFETLKSRRRPRTWRSVSRWNHHDDVFAFDTAEKTDKVTTNTESDGASGIGCVRREADFAESAR